MRCKVADCGYDTVEDEEGNATMADKIAILGFHRADVHGHLQQPVQPVPVVQQHRNTQRLIRPKLKLSGGKVTETQWEYFVHSWAQYKTLYNLGNLARSHLEQALGEVGKKVFDRLGKLATDALTEEQLLAEAKDIAVEQQNRLIARLQLAEVKQEEGEAITAFETRLRPVARLGKFKKLCTRPECGEEVDYTEEVVLDNLIRGLREEEIKTKVMAMDDTTCTMKTVLKLVQAEELGRRSVRAAKDMEGVYALSTYQRQRRAEGIDNKVAVMQGTPGPVCRSCGFDKKHEVCPAKDQNCLIFN